MSFPAISRRTVSILLLSTLTLSGAQSFDLFPATAAARLALSAAQSGRLAFMAPARRSSPAAVQTHSAQGNSRTVYATAYSSEVAQTDSTPFITATGTRTRPGVLAVSPDLLRSFPYGTRVRLEDPSGRAPWLSGRVFIVEDAMNARFTNRVDLWMGSRAQALQWGGRTLKMTALR